jgi:REP element-mobilizing transposase RayT
MSFHERRLPHWHPKGKDLFLTWRLHDSLPSQRYIPPNGLTGGKAFVSIDRYLDRAQHGPTWLRRPEVAQVVVNALHYGERNLAQYRLHAYVVLPNHVHVLLAPRSDPVKILHSLKTFSAREANKLLDRTGLPFWQREYYDHWIRDDREFEKVRFYIENNPVAAGLVTSPEKYPWSSAAEASKDAGFDTAPAPPWD